ncbi:MAG: hypothetical protein LIP01_08005, partial [Tannerellaceae bacterium]|nr:hypothetical protein [Tannerellaceae bacterium]
MEYEKLYQWMENPSLLTEETLSMLEDIVEEYPWFSTARSLYLKNLSSIESPVFEEELQKHAVYIADRKNLYTYLHYELPVARKVPADVKEEEPVEDSFLLIDSFLTAQGTLGAYSPTSTLSIQPSVSTDYIVWAYSNADAVGTEKEETVPLKHQDLIDSFLTEEENRPSGSRFQGSELGEEKVPGLIIEEDEEYEKVLDDSYLMETLARIYVKQRRYDRALQIIRKLSLK